MERGELKVEVDYMILAQYFASLKHHQQCIKKITAKIQKELDRGASNADIDCYGIRDDGRTGKIS